MNRYFVTAVLLVFIISGSLVARDWAATIRELESGPRNAKTNEQIATCCNNLALEYERKKDWNNAEKYMKKAYDLNRSQKLYQKHLGDINLSHAWDLYQNRSSRHVGGAMHSRAKLLAKRALSYNRNLPEAHILIGRIEYDNQKMPAAKRAYLTALKLKPDYPGLRDLVAKVDREMKVEQKFTKKRSSFFEVRYQNNNVDDVTADGLKLAMETARDVVGRDYGFRPKHKIVLLVYSSDDFSNLRLGPHWAGGLYDGKIRLPLDGQQNLKYAVGTLFHEYTHAVLHDLARGHCPRWLNEGLSEIQGQKIEPVPVRELSHAAKADELVPLESLSEAFQSGNTRVVKLAYEQAHSIASFLVEKYGYRRIRTLMNQLSREVPVEIAAREAFGVPLAKLETDWKRWLITSRS